jgi:hypothetical protein
MTPRVITLRAGIEPKSSASSPGKILLLAHREDLSLKDAALKLGYLTATRGAARGHDPFVDEITRVIERPFAVGALTGLAVVLSV